MTNENRLVDWQCPVCHHEGPFKLEVKTTIKVTLHDDGTQDESFGDLDYSNTDMAECPECEHREHIFLFTCQDAARRTYFEEGIRHWNKLLRKKSELDQAVFEDLDQVLRYLKQARSMLRNSEAGSMVAVLASQYLSMLAVEHRLDSMDMSK